MRSQWTRLAAGLLIAATAGMFIFHREFATVAYALEETLEANLGLRSIHIRVEPPGDGMREIWAEFGADGKLLRSRMNAPNTEDGEKEIVWQGDRAEVWFKRKGSVLVIKDPQTAEKISKELVQFDPKAIMEKLHDAEANGKVKIETRAPSAEGEPVTLVATFKDSSGMQEVYKINPETKLVEQLKKYRLADNKRELISSIDFLEYNQPIPPSTFVLDVPDDVTRVDWTTQEVGVPKGDLTDHQIAKKVAREFFEALIAKDYGRAGTILSGTPAAKMEETFGKVEFLRIVSIGEPTPHPDPRTRYLQVPCEVEIRMKGKTVVKELTPLIRPVEGQPDRWLISGGI